MYTKRTKYAWRVVAVVCLVTFLFVNILVLPGLATNASAAASDHPRRLIGYFCEWADQESKSYYTVDKIPWDKLTHINYAFAQINSSNQIDFIDKTAATEKVYPGQDASLPYKGHFNLLSVYKKKYPDVKTMISVGGWAATNGFYTMAETAAGREAFANSCVDFIRKYDFNGVDIDYEYPTTTAQAGNPKDSALAEPRRATLYSNYVLLMKTLREKLDAAGQQDGKHYLLSAAVTASSWILGGMFVGEYAQYLDYANLMTYDFHGSWNGYVGHDSALYPDSRDTETIPLGVPVLNIDWAYRYYSGVLSPDKINIGAPFYSRGWKNVTVGSIPGGLYGSAATTGGGADGEFGIWNDPAPEAPSGTNPIWHIKNLLQKPGNERYWDDVTKEPNLWNSANKVFLSYEDEQSISEKCKYIIDKGIGGLMFWELAGDFDKKADGTYGVGYTLTTTAYNLFKSASPANPPAKPALPAPVNFKSTFTGSYDHPNYTYKWTITNNTGKDIPGGATLEFDLTDTCTFGSWGGTISGPTTSPYDSRLKRWKYVLPAYQSIPNGGAVDLQGSIKLCFSNGPKHVVLNGNSSTDEYNIIMASTTPIPTDPVVTPPSYTPTPTPTSTPTLPLAIKVAGYVRPAFDTTTTSSELKAGFKAENTLMSVLTDNNGYFEKNMAYQPSGFSLKVSKNAYLARTISNIPGLYDITIGSQSAPVEIWAGDANGDNVINMADIMEIAKAYNTTTGSANYNADYDYNKDGAVNMADIMIAVQKFNKTATDYPVITFTTNTPTSTPTHPIINTNTPTSTTAVTNTPTPTSNGIYSAWDSNSYTYKVGDKVSYSGSNYECISGHTSNVAWDPVSTNLILWKKI